MNAPSPSLRLELNGSPACADDLRHLALVNYGHFTTMQVRARAVRGLDLHLARLEEGTRALFGGGLETARVRDWLRQALDGSQAAHTARITVFSRDFDHQRPERAVEVDVLVSVGPPSPLRPPLRVCSALYARETPEIKHVGTFGVLHQLRRAREAGFDDVLFVDDGGHVSEGSVWNVCFVDGEGRVVWPTAPALQGVTARLLRAGLFQAGLAWVEEDVRMADVPRFAGAFAVNASGIRPIAAIDAMSFDAGSDWLARLTAALERQPAQAI